MRHDLRGIIASAGFESGDRVVIGHWADTPIGPMTDVMWASPDGERLLLAPSEAGAEFISAVYRFDRVEVVAIEARSEDHGIDVTVDDRRVRLAAGPGWRIPLRRPPWVTRWAEAPVARATMGVRTYGVSPTGVREWYRADEWRPVRDGRASIAGRSLGALGPVEPPCRFGFSEPPRRPSIVAVRPLLEDPSGRLDRVLARWNR
ncbi:MAG: hypothetical protein WKF43_05405 [Acidimicrobiales bacterium]